MLDSLIEVFSGSYKFRRYCSFESFNSEGMAYFKRFSPYQVYYCEEGEYKDKNALQTFYQNRQFELYKEYFLILKEDGMVLHSFDFLGKNKADTDVPLKFTHRHFCGQDEYNCILSLNNMNHFSMNYLVKGPLKNYQMITNYEKLIDSTCDYA